MDQPNAALPLPFALESLLFVADEPLTSGQMARLLQLSQLQIDTALAELARACHGTGIRLQEHAGSYQLVSAPEAAPYVERLLGAAAERRLSAAALETLAIIAYRQPITRAGIEGIRGVNSDRALRTLQTVSLVADVGRLETVGRPVLFGTTMEFLQYFGLESVSQLPPIAEMGAAAPGDMARQLPLPSERPATAATTEELASITVETTALSAEPSGNGRRGKVR